MAGPCGLPHVPCGSRSRYRPRSNTNALKPIVEEHLEEFLQVYDERFRTT
jgi:hypothetical protein